jgi:putative transposase
MANTFSQVYLQFVFAVKRREHLIPREHKEIVHRYITGLVQHRGSKLLAIHCMPDHIHIFAGYRPVIAIPDLVKEIKVESNEFINKQSWMKAKFAWQTGYGVFSYSQSHISNVISYINKQETHHQKHSFRNEYINFLKNFQIPFEEKFLFEFLDI